MDAVTLDVEPLSAGAADSVPVVAETAAVDALNCTAAVSDDDEAVTAAVAAESAHARPSEAVLPETLPVDAVIAHGTALLTFAVDAETLAVLALRAATAESVPAVLLTLPVWPDSADAACRLALPVETDEEAAVSPARSVTFAVEVLTDDAERLSAHAALSCAVDDDTLAVEAVIAQAVVSVPVADETDAVLAASASAPEGAAGVASRIG